MSIKCIIWNKNETTWVLNLWRRIISVIYLRNPVKFSVGKHENVSMDLNISSFSERPHYNQTISIVYSDQERIESEASEKK